jgi:hypothetical protein
MWHQIHAEILQESGFDLTEDEIHVMDEQIVDALHAIVASGKPSIKADLQSPIVCNPRPPIGGLFLSLDKPVLRML